MPKRDGWVESALEHGFFTLAARIAGAVVALVAAHTLLACLGLVTHAPWTAGLDAGGHWAVGFVSLGIGVAASWLALGGTSSGALSLGGGGDDLHDSRSPHIVRSGEEGVVLLERRGIEALAQGAGEQTPGVQSVDVRLTPIGASSFWVFVDATLRPQQPIKATSQQLRQELRGALEDLAGVEVQQISIVARVSPEGIADRRPGAPSVRPSRR